MKSPLLVCFLLISCISFSQKRTIPKFGEVKVQDFTIQSPLIDSSTEAVVIFDVASSDFEGNNNGDFSLVFKHHKRLFIKKRTAFDDATIEIPLYSGGNSASTERVADLQASTFINENGTVKEVKLNKDDLLTEKVNNNISNRKFTFPSLQEGCIIEYEYTIRSPYYGRLKSWVFQGEHPVLWSEYTVTIPPLFDFITSSYGYLPYTVNVNAKKFKNYSIRLASNNAYQSAEYVSLSGDAVTNTWGIENIPPFKAESYVSTARNHISRIQFQLRSIKYSETNITRVIKDWYSTASELMKDEDFGLPLNEDNDWLKDELKKLDHADALQKAKNIYVFVRDNFTCNDLDNKWLTQSLKKTFQSKVGSVGDINVLLAAMLKKAGLQVVPVMLSTTDNGIVNEEVALLIQYNYVVVKAEIGGGHYLLDASRPRLGFGLLAPDCYNGSGRQIQQIPELLTMSSDSISDYIFTTVSLTNDESSSISGNYLSTLGKYSSLSLRNKMASKTSGEVYKELTEGYPQGFTFSNISIDSLKQYDFPVSVKYDLKIKEEELEQDIIYFNPMLNDGYEKNPFASEERLYPVEMPYCMNETYLLTMDIPKGYSVEELPKSARVHFNETEGGFEYIIAKQGNQIMLRSKIFFKKATFTPDDYEVLRNFFGFIVKKHAEQIVFKKN